MAEQEKQEQTDIVKAEAQEETALTQQGSPPSPAMILQRAVDKGADPASIEKLVEMYERLENREARKRFQQAMKGFQSELPVIPKNKTAGKKGFMYKYADLEQIEGIIKPLMDRWGLSYRFDTKYDNNMMVRICTVTHIDGHGEKSEFPIPIDSGRMNNIQQFGSSRSYGNRYVLMDALGIITGDEDDDAQGAVPPQTPQDAPQRNQRQRQPHTPPPSGNGGDGGNGPPTDKMKARFHAMGNELYGDAWDTKRPEIVQAYIKAKRGEAGLKSSNDLTKDEMSDLMDKLERKLDQINSLEFKEGTGDTDDDGFMHICTVYDGGEAYNVSARGEEAEPKCSCPAGYQGDKPVEKWCIHIREAKKWCEQQTQ